MKVKTSELSGAALDWAVATAEGHKIMYDPMGFGSGANGGYWIWGDGLSDPKLKIGSCSEINYSPSTRWKECGPLIEKYWIDLFQDGTDDNFIWYAKTPHLMGESEFGDTPLIAICRAVVASALGDEIDLPEGLQ